MDNTGKILAGMLCENTGRAMCDSGGEPTYDANGNYTGSTHGYGRHYERNAKRKFENEQASRVRFSVYGKGDGAKLSIDAVHNVYHWLKEKLTYDAEMDVRFQAFASQPGNEGESWLSIMEAFPTTLKDADENGEALEVAGIYGEGRPVTVNTYNGADLLSQVLQYVYFEVKYGDAYVILQIHNGADVRGGYTIPRVFTVNDELGIFNNADGSIVCGHCDHYWHTDDGSNWYEDGTCGRGLEDMPVCEVGRLLRKRETTTAVQMTTDGGNEIVEAPPVFSTVDGDGEVQWGRGVVFVDDDGNGYCPDCGEKLSISF